MKSLSGLSQKLIKFFPGLKLKLLYAGINKTPREYLAGTLQKSIIAFIALLVTSFTIFLLFGIQNYLLIVLLPVVFSLFFFSRVLLMPTLKANKRIRNLEKNLLPALQSIFIQINAGISLFEVLTNISRANFGEVSKEFKKAVTKINAGRSQLEALEELIVENPSVFFRRSMWQIINGMKSGADLSSTISQAVTLLSEEKIIQIQNYGARLSPLAMFYMLVGMILPALSIIFIILLLSFANLEKNVGQGIFFGFYFFILIFQIFFLGLINSRRPSLI